MDSFTRILHQLSKIGCKATLFQSASKIRTRICRGKQKTTKEKKHKVFPANRLLSAPKIVILQPNINKDDTKHEDTD